MMKKIVFVSNSSFSLWNFRYPVMKKLKELGYHVLAIAPEDEFSGSLKGDLCKISNFCKGLIKEAVE